MIRRCEGEVYLVGAGPGDPDLITVKGLRLLQSADVVVHDRLVSNEMLKLCHAKAELIDVGKYPDHHRISQSEINQLLVSQANLGKRVVRLKGGDPFVFGRGFEEWQACEQAGILCHVVPGISSCIAAPASMGVPVTTRGIARTFAVVTGQTDPSLPENDIDFDALAKLDTVVIMMGRRNLRQLTAALMAAGRASSTPAACIQQATMQGQKKVAGTLGTITQLASEEQLHSPMVVIIGEVVGLVGDRELIEMAASHTLNPQPIA